MNINELIFLNSKSFVYLWAVDSILDFLKRSFDSLEITYVKNYFIFPKKFISKILDYWIVTFLEYVGHFLIQLLQHPSTHVIVAVILF